MERLYLPRFSRVSALSVEHFEGPAQRPRSGARTRPSGTTWLRCGRLLGSLSCELPVLWAEGGPSSPAPTRHSGLKVAPAIQALWAHRVVGREVGNSSP